MKSKQLIAPKKYCYSCGVALEGRLAFTTYDNDTGKPYHRWDYSCPNNKKAKYIWETHRIWEPLPSY